MNLDSKNVPDFRLFRQAGKLRRTKPSFANNQQVKVDFTYLVQPFNLTKNSSR